MTWLTPLNGVILAAAVIPPLIVLYFLRLRRKPQPIATTLLWKRAVEDLRANAPFQRLRKSLLLLLQLLALALLAFSVMQPQIQGGTDDAGRRVILIDNSASMTASDGRDADGQVVAGANAVTRLDEAKRLARERIEAVYSGGLFSSGGGETMIVSFSNRAEVMQRFTDSRAQLLAAIDQIQPTHAPTAIDEALKLARASNTNTVDAMGEARPIGEIPQLELFSDGRILDLREQVLRGETLIYTPIGSAEADNVAITTMSVERPYDRPAAVEVFAALQNFNQQDVNCDIQLSVDGRAIGIQEVALPAARIDATTQELLPGRSNVNFTPFDQPRGAVIEVANLRPDLLAADNAAHLVIPPPKRLRVGLVAADGARSLVRRVLEGLKLERLERLRPERYEELANTVGGGGLDAFDLIVFDGYQAKVVPPGRYLSFGPTPPIPGFNDFGEGQAQVVLSVREEHPAARYLNLDALFISKYRKIQPGDEVEVVAEGSGGPVILAMSRGAMQVIHVPFDPLESNWPFQRSFVTFIFNAVDYLGHSGESLATQALKAGEAITTRLPADARDIQVLTPDGVTHRPEVTDPAQFAWGPVALSGVHTVSWTSASGGSGGSPPLPVGEGRGEGGVDDDGRQFRMFAVNLESETEGNIGVVPKIVIGQEEVAGEVGGARHYTPLWPWAVGLCLALLMFEWYIYHRKMFI